MATIQTPESRDAMARQEVNSQLIITVGVISVLLLAVIAIGLEAWFRYEESTEVEAKWASSRNVWLANIRNEQLTSLGNYRWVDQGKQTVAIPIAQAMDLVVRNGGNLPATQPKQPAPPATGRGQ